MTHPERIQQGVGGYHLQNTHRAVPHVLGGCFPGAVPHVCWIFARMLPDIARVTSRISGHNKSIAIGTCALVWEVSSTQASCSGGGVLSPMEWQESDPARSRFQIKSRLVLSMIEHSNARMLLSPLAIGERVQTRRRVSRLRNSSEKKLPIMPACCCRNVAGMLPEMFSDIFPEMFPDMCPEMFPERFPDLFPDLSGYLSGYLSGAFPDRRPIRTLIRTWAPRKNETFGPIGPNVPLGQTSFVPKGFCAKRLLCETAFGPNVSWAKRVLGETSLVPNVLCAKRPLCQTSFVRNVVCAKRLFVPNVALSHREKTVSHKNRLAQETFRPKPVWHKRRLAQKTVWHNCAKRLFFWASGGRVRRTAKMCPIAF